MSAYRVDRKSSAHGQNDEFERPGGADDLDGQCDTGPANQTQGERPRPRRPTQALTSLLSWRGVSLSEATWPTYLNIRLLLTNADRALARGYTPYSTIRHLHSRQDDI